MITTNDANVGPRGHHVKTLSEDTVRTFGDDMSVFDLGENYQSAVDCLIQCESIIKSLQTQLAAKDEELVARDGLIVRLEERLRRESSRGRAPPPNDRRRLEALRGQLNDRDEQIASLETQVAGLEGKLIEMSLELASSKADHDRREQDLRRLRRRTSGIEDEKEERRSSWQPPSTIVEKDSGHATADGGNAHCVPDSVRQREEPAHHRGRNPRHHQRTVSRSWSGRDEAPKLWRGIDTTAWPSKQAASFNSFSEGERRRPQEGASRRNDSWRNDAPAVKQGGVGRLSSLARQMSHAILQSPDDSDGAVLDDSGKASGDSKGSMGSLHHDWPHNSSQTHRRLSNISQFILNKTMEHRGTVLADRPTLAKAPLVDDVDGRSAPQPERLSCVIFPVSSHDCLVGLCRDAEEGEAHARTRRLENGPIDW